MCASYVPVTREDRLMSFFGADAGGAELREGPVFPMSLIPMIRLTSESAVQPGDRILDPAIWRFVPKQLVAAMTRAQKGWDQTKEPPDPAWARNTFNVRSEEVEGKKTYAKAWRDGKRCILPAEWYYEPRYFGTVQKPGKSERWRIQQAGGVPLGIAGIYRTMTDKDTGVVTFCAAMLTVNADGHPIGSLFHRPGDERRMPVILSPEDYSRWLSCTPAEAKELCVQWHGPLDTFADPLPGQARKVKVEKPPAEPKPPKPPKPTRPPRPPKPQQDLF